MAGVPGEACLFLGQGREPQSSLARRSPTVRPALMNASNADWTGHGLHAALLPASRRGQPPKFLVRRFTLFDVRAPAYRRAFARLLTLPFDCRLATGVAGALPNLDARRGDVTAQIAGVDAHRFIDLPPRMDSIVSQWPAPGLVRRILASLMLR